MTAFPSVVSPLAGAVKQHAIRLRYFQNNLKADIYQAWAHGAPNVLAVLPTGGGKTVTFASILQEFNGASVAIAHRQELVGQISVALARYGVRHKIIAPTPVIKAICRLHLAEVGTVWYDPNARCAVAGVDTLTRRGDKLANWLASVGLWVQDEAHHVLAANKWGKAAGMFPNARGLGVTATPVRADGKGLGRHAHGLFDALVLGPSMRALIEQGYLTDARVVVAESDLHMLEKPGASGDWSADQLKKAARGSHIVGDVVATYQKWVPGKLAVVFAPVVETATEMAAAFRKAGVPAEVVSADTPDDIRREILGRFRRREILILVNVDLFGEGFDLPAIEAVIMARPTESFSLFAQQWGRVLRLLLPADLLARWDDFTVEQRLAYIAASDKPFGWVIDHVGNIVRHGLPDARNNWTLDARASGGGESDAESITACVNPSCAQVYRRFLKACPYCGHVKPPVERSTPEAVMGDLVELDPETLAAMRGAVAAVALPTEDFRTTQAGLPHVWAMRNTRLHDEARRAFLNLKDASEWLVGEWLAEGLTLSDCHRRFFLRFGLDVLTAYALPKAEAQALAEKIDTLLTTPSIAGRIYYETNQPKEP